MQCVWFKATEAVHGTGNAIRHICATPLVNLACGKACAALSVLQRNPQVPVESKVRMRMGGNVSGKKVNSGTGMGGMEPTEPTSAKSLT